MRRQGWRTSSRGAGNLPMPQEWISSSLISGREDLARFKRGALDEVYPIVDWSYLVSGRSSIRNDDSPSMTWWRRDGLNTLPAFPTYAIFWIIFNRGSGRGPLHHHKKCSSWLTSEWSFANVGRWCVSPYSLGTIQGSPWRWLCSSSHTLPMCSTVLLEPFQSWDRCRRVMKLAP